MKRYFQSNHYHAIEMAGFLAFAAVIALQRFIRPVYTEANETIRFILGISPNFFAGIAMTISFFIYRMNFLTQFKLSNQKLALISGLISFFGLLLWEYIQTFAGKYFDWMDIIASAAGASISMLLLFYFIQVNQKKGIYDL